MNSDYNQINNYDINFNKILIYNVLELFDGIPHINNSRHSLVFYENVEFRNVIQFLFFKVGLERGEHCVYLTLKNQDIDALENSMRDFGIDVNYYKAQNLLHIVQVADPLSHPEGVFKRTKSIMKDVVSQFNSPYRLTDSLFSLSSSSIPSENVNEMLQLEEMVHMTILSEGKKERYESVFLCTYHVDRLENILSDSTGWIKGMLLNHNAVIYLPDQRNGLVLQLD